MREVKGCAGAKIVINAAPFKLVKRMRQCIAVELQKMNIDVGNPKSLDDLREQFNGNVSKYLNMFKNLLLGLEVSSDFESIIWQCLSECLYDNKAITEQLFDDIPEARQDYDMIVLECMKENLMPFFKSLGGTLSIHSESNEEAQK